jgi:hypothetical protein
VAPEAREAGLLTGLEAAEEALEGQVQALEDHLRLVGVDQTRPALDARAHRLQLPLLGAQADAHPAPPRPDALLERRVPEVLEERVLLLQRLRLRARRVKAEAQGAGDSGHDAKNLT